MIDQVLLRHLTQAEIHAAREASRQLTRYE